MASANTSGKTNIPPLKCLVWDLDNTLWEGTLAEGDEVVLKPGVLDVIRILDQRGILQSIASKNDEKQAFEVLKKLGIDQYFLFPEIHWNPKSTSIRSIADNLNIAQEAIGFIDDQDFERNEVSFQLPEISVYDASQIPELASLPEFNPVLITPDARKRRQMYQDDHLRQQAEAEFEGTDEAFLNSLDMQLELLHATESDLDRLQELTERTHQLNTTGLTFSQAELRTFIDDPEHELWVINLSDRFGSYGSVGVVLLKKKPQLWNLRLFLLSCRVMSRGIGSALITYIKNRAYQAGVELHADFKTSDRNRMMYMTYKFAGFEEIEASASSQSLRCTTNFNEATIPSYISLKDTLI